MRRSSTTPSSSSRRRKRWRSSRRWRRSTRGGTVALEAALTAIAESGAPVAAPAPALSAETQRLLATDANRLDAELLEIFLIEATEVLDAVVENRAELERNPGDREV